MLRIPSADALNKPATLVVADLRKTFHSGPPWRRAPFRVLDGVDLSLCAGETLALLGRNGAGKTTFLKILASLVTADSGTVEIVGETLGAAADVRRLVGFAGGDERSFVFRLTGRQNLRFFAALYGLRRSEAAQRIDELALAFDLAPHLDRKVEVYATGVRARLGLARAFLHSPPLVLLDEPTRSLDAAQAARLHEFLGQRARAKAATLLVTHLADEAAQVANRIAVLDSGRLELHAPGSDWQRRLTAA